MTDSFFSFLKQFAQIFQWWVMVAPWEQGLRIRLGKHVKLLATGIRLRIPFIDVVYIQTVRRRVATMPTQTVTTLDGKPLTIGATLGYAIRDLKQLYSTLDHPQDTIVNEALQAIAMAAHTYKYEQLEPTSLAEAARQTLHFEAYGLSDISIHITDIVSVRTYRLIQDTRGYFNGDVLSTSLPKGTPS